MHRKVGIFAVSASVSSLLPTAADTVRDVENGQEKLTTVPHSCFVEDAFLLCADRGNGDVEPDGDLLKWGTARDQRRDFRLAGREFHRRKNGVPVCRVERQRWKVVIGSPAHRHVAPRKTGRQTKAAQRTSAKRHEERTPADAPSRGARLQGTTSSFQTWRFSLKQRLDARASIQIVAVGRKASTATITIIYPALSGYGRDESSRNPLSETVPLAPQRKI